MKNEEIIGKKYNKLTVIEFVGVVKRNKTWLCKCDCGNYTTLSTNVLKTGHAKSCGCIHREQLLKKNTKHGMYGTSLYQKWLDIKKRCFNKKSKDYINYGGRGIKVCEDWVNDFGCFYRWAIESGYTEHLKKYGSINTTIDRIDVNGNYEPSNCR